VREWYTGGESCVTSITATVPRTENLRTTTTTTTNNLPSMVVAGYGDGKIRIYDTRLDSHVGQLPEHSHWVVLADFVKDERELLTGEKWK